MLPYATYLSKLKTPKMRRHRFPAINSTLGPEATEMAQTRNRNTRHFSQSLS